MDTLGIEPRASRMLSGCDTTTPCAQLVDPKLMLLATDHLVLDVGGAKMKNVLPTKSICDGMRQGLSLSR